jgi:hypothetical protein
VKLLQTLVIPAIGRHTLGVGKLIGRLRQRRRDRRLSRDLERRFREQADSRTAAAARLAEDLHQS